jgi:uncharacterized membrane protein YcjF (UPF0283 family)
VWGSFEHIDEACAVIRAARAEGRPYSVLAPFYHHEIHAAMGHPQSRLPFWSLCLGAIGIFFGYAVPSWMSLDWVLPVSSKPTVSIPPFTIYGFELMVLLAGVGSAVGIALFGFVSAQRRRLPRSKAFRDYRRFSRDRFGVAVMCEGAEADKVERLMREHSAEEVVREA